MALLVEAELHLINQAEELVVLADSSKFTKRSGLVLCALRKVRRVITDSNVESDVVRMLRQAGVRVDIVEPERSY